MAPVAVEHDREGLFEMVPGLTRLQRLGVQARKRRIEEKLAEMARAETTANLLKPR